MQAALQEGINNHYYFHHHQYGGETIHNNYTYITDYSKNHIDLQNT